MTAQHLTAIPGTDRQVRRDARLRCSELWLHVVDPWTAAGGDPGAAG